MNTQRKKWRGFGQTYDNKMRTWRPWYVDKEGRRRWMDNRELVEAPKSDIMES